MRFDADFRLIWRAAEFREDHIYSALSSGLCNALVKSQPTRQVTLDVRRADRSLLCQLDGKLQQPRNRFPHRPG